MDYEVVWTKPAIADVEAIVSQIAERAPDTARRIGRGLLASVKVLGSFPMIGPIYRSGSSERHREITFKTYRIFYRVVEESRRVEILTVRHAARRGPMLPE